MPSELYRQYTQPKEDGQEEKVKLQIFSSAPLYAKIIENLNNHTLPADERRFANSLKDDPYNVNANSAERAAKIFFQNCRDLKLLINSTFRFSLEGHNHGVKNNPDRPPENMNNFTGDNTELLTLPVQLGSRKGSIVYPKKLTKRDIRIYAKALEFIATSIDEDGDEQSEISISIVDNQKKE